MRNYRDITPDDFLEFVEDSDSDYYKSKRYKEYIISKIDLKKNKNCLLQNNIIFDCTKDYYIELFKLYYKLYNVEKIYWIIYTRFKNIK